MADQAKQLKTIADNLEVTWQSLRRAAANIAGLLQAGRATCDEVRAYNLWAVAVYNTQRGMLATLRANGEQGVPELPPAPTLFTWKGVAGADAWKIDCGNEATTLSGAMKKALKGPTDTTQYLSTNEVNIVTQDQFLTQPDNAPSFAQLIALQQQRAQEGVAGLGVAWSVVILIAGITIGVGIGLAAIMSYLKSSDIQEANTKQTALQAEAFANYTNARLTCYSSCTASGKSTEECVATCAKLVDKPKFTFPGAPNGKWGMLQWIGFTVVAGAGTLIAVKVWQRKRAGKPIFQLPESIEAAISPN